MEQQALATSNDNGKVLESVILKGDISALTPTERVQYYKAVCESVGLNPLTQPLAYIVLNGRSVLYAQKGATDQLRKIHGVSVVPGSTRHSRVEDVHVVMVDVSDKDGRTDCGTGAVTIGNLKGDPLANALMKAETKAKRRATLSICGLGMLDESELETIPAKAKEQPVPLKDKLTAQLKPAVPPPLPVERQIDGWSEGVEPVRASGGGLAATPATHDQLVTSFDQVLRTHKTVNEAQGFYRGWIISNQGIGLDTETMVGDIYNAWVKEMKKRA